MNESTLSEFTSTAVFLKLLNEAAAAHGIYEERERAGVHDDEWPRWYAEHMSGALEATGYRIVGLDR